MASKAQGASGLAGRYAQALFELAVSNDAVEQVAQDLSDLSAMLADSEDLSKLVLSPVIAREEQGRAMTAVMDKAQLSDLTKRFIGVVAQNRRLFELEGMINGFEAFLAEHKGEVSAEVTSSKKLTQKQVDSLTASLKEAIGSDVAVEQKVDSALLGGLVVKVGSRMVDSSLRTKLQHLQLAMKGVG
ncbi:ATP synthase subunit delta [Candidatus Terasakiella magnetica]|uniref:ATP synthase subunit delta n=1 Tax=Candidatus Terasakiella magnetica TaxID=1867952 RepID=A0A1C3RKA1_9PROT|nr:F0F1 ATP synthase subunit delta [Candidatus Terasakiella magnetica]SCA57750.1 ATP synthase subunit delta [Candidatus Terasakiella magnetica]